MPVTYDHSHFNNFSPAITIEEAFKFYAAFSGIQSFNFDALFEQLSSSGWASATATGTYSATGVTLHASGLPGGWYSAEQSANMPTSLRATYHKSDYRQGLYVSLPDGSRYIAGTDSSGYPVIMKYSSGAWATVQFVPLATPQVADVIVSFRQMQFEATNSDFWRCISIYMNDALVTTYMEFAAEPIDGNIHIGLAVYGGDVRTYTNLRVGELTMFAEYGTLDAGTDPISGLQLTTDGLNIRFRVRFDGSLRAHRVKAIASTKTIPDDATDSIRAVTDFRQLKSHVRMMGAYTWAETYSRDLAKIAGHRFVQTDNPMLMSESECYDEALRVIKRIEEAAFGASAEAVGMPLLEIEDRISLSSDEPDFNEDNDWLISGIELSIDTASLEQSLSLRKYVWG